MSQRESVRDDFESFMRTNALALKRYAFVLTGNEHEAEELLQEVLVRVYQAWWRIRASEAALGYAKQAMARRYINGRVRRREYATDRLGERGYLDPTPDESDRLWRGLAVLGVRQRAVLVLRYYDDLTEAAIADRLGIAVGTVKSQLSRGLQRLRLALDEGDDHD